MRLMFHTSGIRKLRGFITPLNFGFNGCACSSRTRRSFSSEGLAHDNADDYTL